MVRSMYSGVTGMKAHQTKMDVIGNNIANVNTYGFKSGRATFRDIYYQTMKGASGASGSKGGINAAQVGYGSSLGSIDVMHTQSNLSSTGNPLDMAISGDGYFQVMDGDGNKYYTRAGMLDIDSAGNLIDVNGNFVLGTNGDPLGKEPGSQKIFFNIPAVDPAKASKTEEINKVKITITAGQETNEGNIAFQVSSKSMAVGKKAEAIISTSGGVTVYLNSNERYSALSDVQTAINSAIKEANDGQEHPAGPFTFTAVPDPFDNPDMPAGGYTGAEVVSSTPTVSKGSIDLTGCNNLNGFSPQAIGSEFSGEGKVTITTSAKDADGNYTVTAKFAGVGTPPKGAGTYIGKISELQLKNGSVPLLMDKANAAGTAVDPAADAGDTFELNIPSSAALDTLAAAAGGSGPSTNDATASTQSNALGLGISTKLEKGTKGGPQTVADLSSIQIGVDGVITAIHGILGELAIGRIDLVTFENPGGLVASGNSYYTESANSGTAKPGITGDSSTGMLAQSSLELSNVDLSQEFADMIVTQRGFQANSRLITVSDTMLEELINLKR